MKKENGTLNDKLREIFGPLTSEETIINELRKNQETWDIYCKFSQEIKDKLMGFLTGKSGVEISYDPFFKKIMDPNAHPERAESLLSALMGQKVKIIQVEDPSGSRLVEKGSFVIMDILVMLEDRSYTDLEFQKIGYLFPAKRSSCYTADIIIRQYTRLNAELGKDFQYNRMQPVRLVVLMEHSPAAFKTEAGDYIHHKTISYDTGIKLPDLEDTTYIALDSFKENVHNISNKTEAWLSFFSKTGTDDIVKLIEGYPEFADYYKDIAEFRKNPREVVSMFSEALAIADRNAELLWIDEMRAEMQRMKEENAESHRLLAEKDEALAEKDKAIAEKDKAIAEKDKAIAEKDKIIAHLNNNGNVDDN